MKVVIYVILRSTFIIYKQNVKGKKGLTNTFFLAGRFFNPKSELKIYEYGEKFINKS